MSRSMMRHLRPSSPSAAAMCTVFVVLATPPFWFPTAITVVGSFPPCSSMLHLLKNFGHQVQLLGVNAISPYGWDILVFDEHDTHYPLKQGRIFRHGQKARTL